MKCARCDDKICYQGKDCTKIKDEIINLYSNKEYQKLAKVASEIEAKYYMKLTRLGELIRFCQNMNFKHLGIAFCIGLSREVEVFEKLLTRYFKVSSVCCKICGIRKERFDLAKIRDDRFESMCNPVGQAKILNKEKTDLNIIFGLCIGHDILFTEHSHAPVTTFVVKDRVLAHNPIGALYSGYYREGRLL